VLLLLRPQLLLLLLAHLVSVLHPHRPNAH
jgi:hypothetical protein